MEKKPLIIVVVFFYGLFFLWTIFGILSPAVITIKVSGSTTVLPIGSSCAEDFMENNPNYDIQVSGGGSSVGVANAGEGTIDIGMASRDVKSGELEDYQDLYIYGVAKDGLAVCVNDGNNIDGLNFTVIYHIFNGTSGWTTWDEINEKSGLSTNLTGDIVVLGRDSNSGTRASFEELVNIDDNPLEDEELAYDQELGSNGEVGDKLSTTSGAIGYLGLGYIDKDGIKALPVNGVDLEKSTVQEGSYKLSRTLFMMTKGKPDDAEQAFLDFVLSDAGQAIVEEEGYIALGNDYENPHIKP
ncbi:MAG: phosphate ABC transporter substrate-binding protein [Promethearchaeia archaeon]